MAYVKHMLDVAEIEVFTVEALLLNKSEIENKVAEIPKLRGHFRDYLQQSYCPFFLEGTASYQEKLLRVIDKTMYEDIANHYRLNTDKLPYFKRLLSHMATVQPGELNRNSISKHLGIDNNTVQHYLQILQGAGLVELLRGNKIYLDNPNLCQSISYEIGQQSKVCTIRELFFINMLRNAGHRVH